MKKPIHVPGTAVSLEVIWKMPPSVASGNWTSAVVNVRAFLSWPEGDDGSVRPSWLHGVRTRNLQRQPFKWDDRDVRGTPHGYLPRQIIHSTSLPSICHDPPLISYLQAKGSQPVKILPCGHFVCVPVAPRSTCRMRSRDESGSTTWCRRG